MRVSWPMLPLVGFLFAFILLVLGASMLVLPHQGSVPSVAIEPVVVDTAVRSQELRIIESLPASDTREPISSLLSASPFSPTRAAFSRSNEISSPAAQTTTYNPEFVGFLGIGSQRRVMIMWEESLEPETHEIGADTPWGMLIQVEQTQLVFLDGDVQRTLALFGE